MPLRRKAFCWAYRACGVPKGITGSRDGQPVWETNWREPPTAIGRGGGIVTRIPEIVSSLETPPVGAWSQAIWFLPADSPIPIRLPSCEPGRRPCLSRNQRPG